MNLSAILERVRPGAEVATDGGSTAERSFVDRYSLPIKFVLLEVVLVAAGFGFDTLGGNPTERLDPLNVIGGLFGAFAVIVGVCGVVVALVWAGFTLMDWRSDVGTPN
jgi:hypothetical protein